MRRVLLKGAKTLAQPLWAVAFLGRLQVPLWFIFYDKVL